MHCLEAEYSDPIIEELSHIVASILSLLIHPRLIHFDQAHCNLDN